MKKYFLERNLDFQSQIYDQFMDSNLLELISTPIVFDSLKVDKTRYIRKKMLNFLLVLSSQCENTLYTLKHNILRLD